MPEKKNTTLKKLLILLGIVILIAIVMSVIGKGRSRTVNPPTGLVTSSTVGAPLTPGVQDTQSSAISEQTTALVQLLQEVSTLKLDNDVFLNPVFGALIDISSTIPSDPNPGRVNPFRSIGDDPGLVGLGISPAPNASGVDALNNFLNQANP